MKIFLLSILVAAVAAAPRYVKEIPAESKPVILPEIVALPTPAVPEVIIPDPVILPTPALPELVPGPVILPAPVLPEVVPGPIILPAPVLPEVNPGPVILPAPVLPTPEVVPDAPIVVEQPAIDDEPIVIGEPVIIEKPEPVPQIPTGEIYNDGLVQVTLNAPEEAGYLSTLQSWFSMVLNYFSNGVQTSHQIV